jgi:Metallo-peptidase family M12
VLGIVVLGVSIVDGSPAMATDEPSPVDTVASVPSDMDPPENTTLDGTTLDVLQGEAAVAELEDSGMLDDVAAEAGFESTELVEELIDDPSLFLTDIGQLGYVDALTSQVDGGQVAALTTQAVPADVFALNSRPTASRVIYLDFNGHVTNDRSWGTSTIVSSEFDLDGTPGTFTTAERAAIFEIWQRVTEDYLPFDVNVTTADPGVEALRRTGTIDTTFGQRVVISPTNWYAPESNCGVAGQTCTLGIALVGVFDSNADTPAFVFTGDVPVRTIAEAVAHEAGHTFGLNHDGTSSAVYYNGHGAWAPIMGRGTSASRPVTQWSKGEYAGANNTQDDIEQIASLTGFRPDDHGGSPERATVVGSSSTTSGVIGTTGDRDVFAVDVGAGDLAVTLSPPPGSETWSNLLARLVVRDSSGVVLATETPSVPSSWSIDVTLPVTPGRYTLEVEPIGWLDASSGFTTYGSLGAYHLSVAATPGDPPASAGPSTFTPITPTRLIDTRSRVGGFARLAAGRQVVVQVTDGVSVPADATSAVFSIVAVNPAAPGYLTAYPCSSDRPETSTVNFIGVQTIANNTIAALSSAGQLCVWTSSDADIIVDITGWLGPSGSSRFNPIGPTRVVDTRSGIGGLRMPAGSMLSVDLNGTVPAGSTAVALNVTAVNSSAPGYLSVYPCSGSQPQTSTVNHIAAEARPNNTIVGLSGGRVCIFSYAQSDVLVDLLGSFGATGSAYQPTAPVRVIDTRQYRPPVAAQETVGYSVGGSALGGAVPSSAFVNVTATDHVVPGYVTTFDCGVRRETSTLNQQVGQAAANGAIVPLAPNLQSCAWMYGGGHLIVDLNGWWVP